MKLIIDMNLSPRWELILSNAGLEAVHWSRIGPVNAPDHAIMEYAQNHDYIVLTNDLDFGTILAVTNGEKPSVVQIRATDVSPDIIGPKVLAALKQMAHDLMIGALVTVDTDRTRIRILPLNQRRSG